MKKDNTSTTADWARLNEVVKASGMSVNAFALHIGLPRSENLYQIKKGNHGISKALAGTINSYFPDYSVGGLLSGEPSARMTEDNERVELKNDTVKRITVYNRIALGCKPIYNIYISEDFVNGAEVAIMNKDESLAPKIPVGAMVFLKPARNIISGKFYLIVTDELSIIRKAKVLDNSGTVLLSTIDTHNYPDFEIDRNEITAIYSVEKIFAE